VILRGLTWVVLCSFVAGPVSAMSGEMLRADDDHGDRCHAEGLPCPDPIDDGQPCGPSCACACCPGHALGLAFATHGLRPGLAPASTLRVHPASDLHPMDVLFRVFHPPRVELSR